MIRIGIVGLARGCYLLDNVGAFKCLHKVVAICDVDRARLERYSSEYSSFESYQEMISTIKLDAVYVACPPPIDVDVAVLCLNNNVHAICEVSIARNPFDFIRLEAAARQSSALFYLCENYSFTPVNWSLTRLAARGHFGFITKVSSGYIHDCAGLTFNGESLSWRGQLRRSRRGNDYASHALIPALNILFADVSNSHDYPDFELTSFDGPMLRLGKVKESLVEYGSGTDSIQSDFNYTILSSSSRNAPLVIVEHDTLSPRPPNVVPTTVVGEDGGWIAGRFDGEDGILYEVSQRGSSTRASLYRTVTKVEANLLTLAEYPVRRLELLGWKLPFVLCFERIVESILLNRDDGCLSLVGQVVKFQILSSASVRLRQTLPYGRLKPSSLSLSKMLMPLQPMSE